MSSLPIASKDILIAGHTAVITGASSGIGKAMSLECAKRGMIVWMIDVDGDDLAKAGEMVRKEVVKGDNEDDLIHTRVVDVSDLSAMRSLADEVGDACHFLMNNAGVGSGGGALTTDMDVVTRTMAVNTYGPIHGCLAFVPKMKGNALIVNTGSKQGITMPPGNLTYNMSKAALKCYTEGLEHELRTERAKGLHNIRAALLIPGWVNTSILLKEERRKDDTIDPDSVFFHEEKPASGAWMPSRVVEFLISELDAGRFYVVCPDNDVDRDTDNVRMTWTMQDIVQNRPPLSRWHPEYQDAFSKYLEENKGKL